MKFIYIGVATSLLLTIAAGCSPDETQDETSNELTVAAASDLHRAFSEIGVAFEKETGTPVTFSFGSTGQLADQIENGAPFDVFAAANIEFIDRLDDQDMLVDGTKELYAIGRIGIVYHEDSSFTAEEINQLDSDEINQLDSDEIKRLSIANPEHAPYGLQLKKLWSQLECGMKWKASWYMEGTFQMLYHLLSQEMLKQESLPFLWPQKKITSFT